jgi:hypothetical protein
VHEQTSRILNARISANPRFLGSKKGKGEEYAGSPPMFFRLETSPFDTTLRESGLKLLMLLGIVTDLNTLHAVMSALYEEMKRESLKGIFNREEHETFTDRGEK